MAESEVCEIPSELIRSALQETVEKKLNSKKCKIELSSASKAGSSNFIGIVYRASFYKEDENGSEKNPIHKMIVKTAPQHAVRRELFISRYFQSIKYFLICMSYRTWRITHALSHHIYPNSFLGRHSYVKFTFMKK